MGASPPPTRTHASGRYASACVSHPAPPNSLKSAHLPPPAPGANIPGGDPAGPPVRAFGLPGRPPSGTASPTAYTAAAPPKIFQKAGDFSSGRIFGDRVMEIYRNGICVASRANTGYLRRGSASGFWSVVLRMMLGTGLACVRYRHRALLTGFLRVQSERFLLGGRALE